MREFSRVKLKLIPEIMNDDCTPNEQWEMVFDMVDKEYLDKF